MIMGKTIIIPLLFLLCADYVWSATVIYGHEDPSKNKVKNWNFEQAITNNDWVCNGATCTKVNGGKTGSSAIRVTGRKWKEAGPLQTIQGSGLKKNANYYMSAWIKLLNQGPAAQPYVTVYGLAKFKTGSQQKVENAGQLTFQLQDNEWKQVGQDIKTPANFDSVEIFVRVDPPSVNYLLDTVAFTEIPKHNNNYYNQEIAKHRKNSLTVTGSLRAGLNLAKTTIKVEMTRHEFGFGNAVIAPKFNGNSALEKKFRNFNLEHFNWGGFINDMKWDKMEANKGNVKYGPVDTAIATMAANNMSIRAHTIGWAVKNTNPAWVQAKSGTNLINEINRRIDYYMQHYKGKIFEYDVYNENLHQHFYENAGGDRHIMETMFKRANRLDPKADLCLNDYHVARGGKMASNLANLARHLKTKKVPVHCIGIQSHLTDVPIDPEVLEKRITITTDVGLPVSITELSVHHDNKNTRADSLESALRVYFANPGVRSIVLWGIGNQFGPTWSTNYYLFEGQQMTPNAAGKRLLDILTKEWHTSETYTPSSRSFSKTLSGFRGNYKVTVTTAGKVELEKEFYLGKGNNKVNFSV